MKAPVDREQKTSRRPGLQLSELEVYLADSALETKFENRTHGVFLNLAADPSMYVPLVTTL